MTFTNNHFVNIKMIEIKEEDINLFWMVNKKKDNDGKNRRYYPDFYIPKENLLVEVKSTYTYLADLDKNILKEQCALKSGFNYKLIVL